MPKAKVTEEAKPEVEGWQAEKHTGQRVYHYIEGTWALYGGLGFYTGEVMPHKPGQKKGKEDCSACFKRLERKLAKQQKKEGDDAK